jgi:hypothetical protein
MGQVSRMISSHEPPPFHANIPRGVPSLNYSANEPDASVSVGLNSTRPCQKKSNLTAPARVKVTRARKDVISWHRAQGRGFLALWSRTLDRDSMKQKRQSGKHVSHFVSFASCRLHTPRRAGASSLRVCAFEMSLVITLSWRGDSAVSFV